MALHSLEVVLGNGFEEVLRIELESEIVLRLES